MSDTRTLANEYYAARPLPVHTWNRQPTGLKFMEEAQELFDAIGDYMADPTEENRAHIGHEIGDVANTLTWIAECWMGMTVEECMRTKIEKDRGRGLTKERIALDKEMGIYANGE